MNQIELGQLKEAVDVLTGRRPSNRGSAAVLREDLTGILQLPLKLQSSQLTAAPTMADYNRLQADIRALHAALSAVSSAIGAAIR